MKSEKKTKKTIFLCSSFSLAAVGKVVHTSGHRRRIVVEKSGVSQSSRKKPFSAHSVFFPRRVWVFHTYSRKWCLLTFPSSAAIFVSFHHHIEAFSPRCITIPFCKDETSFLHRVLLKNELREGRGFHSHNQYFMQTFFLKWWIKAGRFSGYNASPRRGRFWSPSLACCPAPQCCSSLY